MLLTDDQWRHLIETLPGLFPGLNTPAFSYLQGRIILECVLWKLAVDLPWTDFPAAYLSAFTHASFTPDTSPSSRQVYRRYRYWRSHGLLLKILTTLISHLKVSTGLDLVDLISTGLVRFECLPCHSWRVSVDRFASQPWVMFTAFLVLSIFTRGAVAGSFCYLFPSTRCVP